MTFLLSARGMARLRAKCVAYIYVLLHPLRIFALRNDDCTALYSPTKRNLSRSRTMGLRDPEQVWILQEDGLPIVLLWATYNMVSVLSSGF